MFLADPRIQYESIPRQHQATIAPYPIARYSPTVAANSATGPENPGKMQALQRRNHVLRRFFISAFRAMAAVRGRPSGLPGSCISGFSACAQLPPIRLRTNVAALN